MSPATLALVVMALAAGVTAASRVTLVDNAYTGLVVGVDDRVDVLQCQDMVRNTKTLLSSASRYLYTATNQRAYLGEVTLVVPSSWPRSCTGGDLVGPATTQSYLSSDVRISSSHPVYGAAPWTRQTSGCGQPGHFIQFAGDYVASGQTNTFGDQGRVLVHEWARYRWGVFEETGYPGDPLYPSFFQRGQHQWSPTGCVNANVSGVTSPSDCDVASNTCTFVPLLNGSNAAVTSSIMYLQSLPQVRHFCNASTHDPSAPTKHNQLCGGRSVWEVLETHPDFSGGNNPPRAAASPPPVNISIVRAAPDRFFFLLESSATLRHQERWDFVSNSIRKFVNWDVPTGVQVGIGHFGSGYATDRNLTTVPDSRIGRGELANIPPIADDVTEEQRNWRAAVDGAASALGERAAGATLIWVAGNQQNSRSRPSEEDVDYVIEVLRQKKIRLVLVFYPSLTPGLSRAAAATGGRVITVEDVRLGDQTSITVFQALAEAYRFALQQYISDKRRLLVRLEDRQFVGNGQQARGSFQMDSSLGVNTTLTVLYNARSEIGYVKLQRPGGEMSPVYTYPDSTNHLQYVRVDNVPGLWRYEIDNLAPSHSSIFVQVTSSASSSRDTVRVEVWTNASPTAALNVSSQPLVLYASVMQGNAPVLDADVTAIVSRPDGQQVQLTLLDNGNGAPDVLHGDGTYARHFFDYGDSSDPQQQLDVRVRVEGPRARVVTGRAPPPAPRALPVDGTPPCCGSTVGAVTSVPVSDLRRAAAGGSVLVTGVGSARDALPPGRVTDLRATPNAARQTVKFAWTAVGDDFDRPNTQVERYEVRYSEDRSRLLQHFSECTSVPHWSEPKPAGTPSLATVEFHTINQLTFFALRGVDAAGNAGPVSNIVSVILPAPPPTSPTPPPTGTTTPVQPTAPPFNNQLLLIVLLCVAGVILLTVLAAMYYYLCRRRGAKPDPAGDLQGYVNSVAVTSSDASREPTPVKLAIEAEREESPPPQPPPLPRDYVPSREYQRWSTPDILHTPDRPDHGRYHPGSGYASHGGYGAYGVVGPPNGRARYNSYQTPYIEDVAFDGRSLESTLPSGSVASLASAGRGRQRTVSEGEPWGDSRPPAVVSDGYHHQPASPVANGYPHHRDSPVTAAYRGSPAGMGSLSSHMDLSASRLAGDRRRRNVTQV